MIALAMLLTTIGQANSPRQLELQFVNPLARKLDRADRDLKGNTEVLIAVGNRLTPLQERTLLRPICFMLEYGAPTPDALQYCIKNLSSTAIMPHRDDGIPDNGFPAARTLRRLGQGGHSDLVVDALMHRTTQHMAFIEQYCASAILRQLPDETTRVFSANLENNTNAIQRSNIKKIMELSKANAATSLRQIMAEVEDIYTLLRKDSTEHANPKQTINKLIAYHAYKPRPIYFTPRICEIIAEVGEPSPLVLGYCVKNLDVFKHESKTLGTKSDFAAATALTKLAGRGGFNQVWDAILVRTKTKMNAVELHLVAEIRRKIDKDEKDWSERNWMALKKRIQADTTMSPVQRSNLKKIIAYYESADAPSETRRKFIRKQVKEVAAMVNIKLGGEQ